MEGRRGNVLQLELLVLVGSLDLGHGHVSVVLYVNEVLQQWKIQILYEMVGGEGEDTEHVGTDVVGFLDGTNDLGLLKVLEDSKKREIGENTSSIRFFSCDKRWNCSGVYRGVIRMK